MSDPGGVTTPEPNDDLEALRAERDRLLTERDAERSARQAAEQGTASMYGQYAATHRQLAESQVANLTAQEQTAANTITSADAEIKELSRQQADLFAEGKFEEAVVLTAKIGDATARRAQATQAQSYYGAQRDLAAKQPADPVDRFLASNTQFNEAERNWIKSNPRYATDEGFRARVNKAHGDALAQGLSPGSTEYFDRLGGAGYMRQAPAAPAPAGSTAGDPGDGGDSPYSSAATDPAEEPQPVPQTHRPAVSSVAARPTGRAPATPRPAAAGTRLNPDQSEVALALSEFMPEEVQNGGDAAIYDFYNKLNNSASAKRRRADWATGG